MARKKIKVLISEVQSVYLKSESHTKASKELSKKYGLTSRAWRYRLRAFEERGLLEPTELKSHKRRDITTIQQRREFFGIVPKKPVPKVVEEKPENFVMVTVHFKIKYERMGAKGWHPFYLEGFFSKILPRNYSDADINNMMNEVQGRLQEFEVLVNYLSLMKDEYEQGIEVEPINQTSKSDGEFKYNYGRREGQARMR